MGLYHLDQQHLLLLFLEANLEYLILYGKVDTTELPDMNFKRLFAVCSCFTYPFSCSATHIPTS